jgi:hypothetical protein
VLGTPSLQNGTRTADASRTADQFVVPPCEVFGVCHFEAYLWTNCDRAGLDLYGAACHCPSEAPCFANLTTDCLIDVGPTLQAGGQTVRLVKAVFADFPPFALRSGSNVWVSVYALGDGRQNARGYAAYTLACDRVCGNFDPACVRNAPFSNAWWVPVPSRRDTAFAVAVLPAPPMRPAAATTEPDPAPECRADINHSGTLSVQDIYDFLAVFFGGCP